MGLDVSHEAFSGAYSAFNRFRQAIAKACGGSFPPHPPQLTHLDPETWYVGEGYGAEDSPGLFLFLGHSDCDGEIHWKDALTVAEEMEELLPKLEEMGTGGGHLEWDGGIAEVARRFIAGCRKAYLRQEDLEFL